MQLFEAIVEANHRALAGDERAGLRPDEFAASLPVAAAPAAASPAAIPEDLQAWLDQQERDILVRALQDSGFNRTAAANRLGLSLRQIRYRIARLGIAMPCGDEPHEEAAS